MIPKLLSSLSESAGALAWAGGSFDASAVAGMLCLSSLVLRGHNCYPIGVSKRRKNGSGNESRYRSCGLLQRLPWVVSCRHAVAIGRRDRLLRDDELGQILLRLGILRVLTMS